MDLRSATTSTRQLFHALTFTGKTVPPRMLKVYAQDVAQKTEIEDAAERCAQLATALCEIPAPTGCEERRGNFVEAKLRETGWRTHRDAVGNIVALHPHSQGADPKLVVAAHLDSVFSNLSSIKVERNDNLLQAPGIADNALGLAGLCHLAQWIGADPMGAHLGLVATVGEEGLGNLRGSRHCVEQLHPQEFVALEGGGLDTIIHRGVGSLRLALEVSGPGGHSWEDRNRPSASEALIAVLADLAARNKKEIGESFNVGRIMGGTGISSIARNSKAEIEFRSIYPVRLERAIQLVHQAFREMETGLVGEVATLGMRPGGQTAQKHPLVQAAVQARHKAHLPPAQMQTASTDANAAMAVGIPSISVSLADSNSVHSLQESVDILRLSNGLAALQYLVSARTHALSS